MTRLTFPCTKCGACCRRASLIGMPSGDSGECIHLREDNTCGIYAKRPLVCNIERIYDEMAVKSGRSKEDFYREQAFACNWMIEKDGLDPKYKIDLEAIRE